MKDVERRIEPVVVLACALLAGALVSVVGACVSAAGAPEFGVVDDWGRVDEAAGRIATWELVLVVLIAAVLVSKVASPTRWTVPVLRVALVEAAVLAVAAVAGALAVLQRKFIGPATPTDLYSDTEKIGEIAIYAGVLIATVAAGWFGIHELRQRRVNSGEGVPSS